MAAHRQPEIGELRKRYGDDIANVLMEFGEKHSIPLKMLDSVFRPYMFHRGMPTAENLGRVIQPAIMIANFDQFGIFKGPGVLTALRMRQLKLDRLRDLARIVHADGADNAEKTLDAFHREKEFCEKHRIDLRTAHENRVELPFIAKFAKALDAVSRHTTFHKLRALPANDETLGNMRIVVKPYGSIGVSPWVFDALPHGPNVGFHDIAVGAYNDSEGSIMDMRVLFIDTNQTDLPRIEVPKEAVGAHVMKKYYMSGRTEWIRYSIAAMEEAVKRANKELPRESRVNAIVMPHLSTVLRYKKDAGTKLKGDYARSLYGKKKIGRLGFSASNGEMFVPHANKVVKGKFLIKMLE